MTSTPTMSSSNPSKHIKMIYISPNFDNLNSFTSISSSHPTLKPWYLPWVLCRILICSTLNSLGKFTLKWYRTTSFLGTVTASNSHVLEQRDPQMRRLGVLSNICRVQNRLRYCGKRRKNKPSEKCCGSVDILWIYQEFLNWIVKMILNLSFNTFGKLSLWVKRATYGSKTKYFNKQLVFNDMQGVFKKCLHK